MAQESEKLNVHIRLAHPSQSLKRQKVFFRVTLPNRNKQPETNVQVSDKADKDISLNEQKLLILQSARENGSVTRKEVEDLISARTTKAFRLLKELCKAGKLEQKGSGRLSTYVIK